MDGHFLTKMTDVFHWIRSAIIKGESRLMKSPRKTRTLYASREGRPSNLTQHFVHGIVPKAFMGWALILTLMAIFLVARESLTGWSSGSSPICSIICILRVRWWVHSLYATQLFLQFIYFTLHVPFTLCMENMAFPSWLTLASMRCMHNSLMFSPLLRVCNWIVMLRAARFCLVQISIILMWANRWLVRTWLFYLQRLIGISSDQIKFSPQTAQIVRTSFDLDPKQDWVLTQQAETINF